MASFEHISRRRTKALARADRSQPAVAAAQQPTVARRFAHDFSRLPVHAPSTIENVRTGETVLAAEPLFDNALLSPGHPLDPIIRKAMGSRFGHDFSKVRVHAGESADRSAAAAGALAYTVGSDIVFATGRYSPRTSDGQRLLAHELTHVIQQRGVPPHMQRKPDPQKKPGAVFNFSVAVSQVIDSDQLLLEFIKQYRKIATDAEADALRKSEGWAWVDVP